MYNNTLENIKEVIVGKDEVIEKLLVALLSGGHVLIEDVPGVGKTTLAKTLSDSLGLSFMRIQFTPDLLPSDILGISIYNQKNNEFEYRKGPIHNDIILADEINRASPKTQSSLLEVMAERQITVDGTTYPMKDHFMVIATQNPVEYAGTFPLPEAQLDRFMMQLSIGYPSHEAEIEILNRSELGVFSRKVNEILTYEKLSQMKAEINQVMVKPSIKAYIVSIVQATRYKEEVLLGASPRASLSLLNAVKSLAFIKNREFVTPDDVKELAEYIISHRLILKGDAKYRGIHGRDIVREILSEVEIPKVELNED